MHSDACRAWFRPPRPGRETASIMTIRATTYALASALAFGLLPACISSSELENTNQASVGQQLTDLDRAYREGIITEKEYLKLRKAIIRKND